MTCTTRALPSFGAALALVILGGVIFVCGEVAVVAGAFLMLEAIHATTGVLYLGLALLGTCAGLLMTGLGGVMMPYASDCMHDEPAARRRTMLTGFRASLMLMIVINGVFMGVSVAATGAVYLIAMGFNLHLAAFVLVTAVIGVISILRLRAMSDAMVSGISY